MSILCTTLLPSYKRPELLVKAIESFRANASEPDRHEVIVRLSRKDPKWKDQERDLLKRFQNCTVLNGKQMNGYTNLGEFYTEMLPEAHGEWINIWDDDMVIEGDNKWDEQLFLAPRKAVTLCEFYTLGMSCYGSGSCDGSGIGWFAHLKTWRETGETAIGFPPDNYMLRVGKKYGWPIHHLKGVRLNHQWQRPYDANR